MKIRVRDEDWDFYNAPRPGHEDTEYGCCHKTQKWIYVNPNESELQVLDTTIHEFLHAYFPDVKEKKVAQCGSQLAELLTRLGYGRIH